MSYDFIKGEVLLIDKAYEWTSFDVVNKLRYHLKKMLNMKKIKVGHAGTLDPLATGLLLLCTGKMTKQINEFQNLGKEYTGVFTIGATTPSYDLETEVQNKKPTAHINEEMIREAANSFLGEINQVPPLFSAVKVEGRRAYQLARKGVDAEISSRRVTISDFDVNHIDKNEIHFRIACSKGTYIRSIARDMGEKLGCGAYLSSLRRTRIGEYKVEKALVMEEMLELLSKSKKIENE